MHKHWLYVRPIRVTLYTVSSIVSINICLRRHHHIIQSASSKWSGFQSLLQSHYYFFLLVTKRRWSLLSSLLVPVILLYRWYCNRLLVTLSGNGIGMHVNVITIVTTCIVFATACLDILIIFHHIFPLCSLATASDVTPWRIMLLIVNKLNYAEYTTTMLKFLLIIVSWENIEVILFA